MTEIIEEVINSIGSFGPALACLLIVLESIIPALPLCVFIVINFMSFGSFWGLIISWIFTVLGCVIAFFLVRKGLQNWFNKKVRKNKRINKLMKKIDNFNLQQLVVILAIPFTPAFAVNIAAGLSAMSLKKYLIALLIGKIFMVYFWGFVGLSLTECLTNPIAIVKVVVLVLIAYVASRLVNKKFDLK